MAYAPFPIPKYIEFGVQKAFSEIELITSSAKPHFFMERLVADMVTELRLGIVEKSPVLLCEEDTLP